MEKPGRQYPVSVDKWTLSRLLRGSFEKIDN